MVEFLSIKQLSLYVVVPFNLITSSLLVSFSTLPAFGQNQKKGLRKKKIERKARYDGENGEDLGC